MCRSPHMNSSRTPELFHSGAIRIEGRRVASRGLTQAAASSTTRSGQTCHLLRDVATPPQFRKPAIAGHASSNPPTCNEASRPACPAIQDEQGRRPDSHARAMGWKGVGAAQGCFSCRILMKSLYSRGASPLENILWLVPPVHRRDAVNMSRRRRVQHMHCRSAPPLVRSLTSGVSRMLDVILVGLGLLLFALSVGYAHACDSL